MQILIRPDDVPLDPSDPGDRARARLHARRGRRLPSPGTALVLLTLAALALRLWIVWQANQLLPDTPERLQGDEGGYDYLAWSLFEGRFFDWPGRVPVYPLFLALCYAVFGHSYAAVLYVQAVLGAATVPLTHRLARRFTTPGLALVPAAIIALHVPLAYHATRLYTEVLFSVLMVVAVLALLRAIADPSAGRFVLAGLALGVATLCRPTPALLVALVPLVFPRVWSLGRRARLAGAYALGVLLPILPWTWHNYRAHDAFLPLAVSTATLWQGSPEFYHVVVEQRRNLMQVWEVELNPARNGGHDAFSIEGDRHFTRRALASIRAEPGLWLRYCAQKAAYFWVGNPVVDWPGYRMFDPAALTPWFPTHRVVGILVSRLLPVVGLLALVAARRRLGELLPILLVLGYFTLVHAVTYPEVRYSEPLHPLLATIIAVGIAELRGVRRPGPPAGRTEAPEDATRLVTLARRG